MTAKEKRGRRRYIAFSVCLGLNRTDLITRLRNVAGEAPYVVQCGGGFAIVRCAPKDVETVIGMMMTADPSSASLMASGTLKALRSKVPGLADFII